MLPSQMCHAWASQAPRPRWGAGALLLLAALIGPPAISPGQPPGESVALQVEAAFQQSMERWAYRQFWTLWESGTRESQFAVTQEEFTAQMERTQSRAATGRRVEDTRITVTSPDTAMVQARIGLEDPGSSSVRFLVRSFVFRREDGSWRPQLWDFLGLAAFSYPQPMYLPGTVPVPCCPPRSVPRR
jgi:hypothetical protein